MKIYKTTLKILNNFLCASQITVLVWISDYVPWTANKKSPGHMRPAGCSLSMTAIHTQLFVYTGRKHTFVMLSGSQQT